MYTKIKYEEFWGSREDGGQSKGPKSKHSEPDTLMERCRQPMCQMLPVNAWQRSSSDHRDIIYGLYAIMLDLGLHLPEPDYNKPLSAVYEEFAISIITHTGNLLLLTAVPGIFDHSGWPSWVPNFAKTRGDVNILEDKEVKAYPSFRPNFHLTYHPGRLSIEGIIYAI